MIKNFLDPKENKNPTVVQKLPQFYWRGGFCLFVELHQEGSAPAACAASLFTILLIHMKLSSTIYSNLKLFTAMNSHVQCVKLLNIYLQLYAFILTWHSLDGGNTSNEYIYSDNYKTFN